MKLSSVLQIIVLSGTLLSGCAKEEKCFEPDYHELVRKYGEGRDKVHKFCKDKGYDRASSWSVGMVADEYTSVSHAEICCEDDLWPF